LKLAFFYPATDCVTGKSCLAYPRHLH